MKYDYFRGETSFEEIEGKFLELLEPKLEYIILNFGLKFLDFETSKSACGLIYFKNDRKLKLILYRGEVVGSSFYCYIEKVSEVIPIRFILTQPPKKCFHTLEDLEIEMTLWVEFLKLELKNHPDFVN